MTGKSEVVYAYRTIPCKETWHIHARNRSCSPCQSSAEYGHTKITQHALVSKSGRILQSVEVGRYTEEDSRRCTGAGKSLHTLPSHPAFGEPPSLSSDDYPDWDLHLSEKPYLAEAALRRTEKLYGNLAAPQRTEILYRDLAALRTMGIWEPQGGQKSCTGT